MCGIVGYIGRKKAYPILIKGLKRLEYRGYDSSGIALISEQQQQLNIGIAHTRWATHAEPCSANAHPHYSSSERLALIHNGIIENYAVIKEKLQAKGYSFKSSTDTEVLVQLIEYIQVTNQIADICIELPETMECLEPLITTEPLQLLAYHIAVCKGMDVDQPRNLTKSVTVE